MLDAADAYEKLGAFYLGRNYDLARGELEDDLLLYDSKDLTTHAVCVGMTGSGKTGLCVGLLEEAAIDGIPALVIDPKGDLANLLLIRRLRAAAEFSIYTPGSEAGIPVSILSSLAAPPAAVLDEVEVYRDRIGSTVTSLLGLLGIDADPIRSREHILLSTILDDAWRQGRSLDLGALIQLIQTPPVSRIGVLNVDSFYPSKDRFELAMALNNLLAAPGFSTWMAGEALDVGRMLYTAEGKPRVSVYSIAHLGEAERMFFVSLLLNETVAWMRSRPGTTSLRAIVYMDEIFGYMPPVAEPPSKKPLLTLLKQARAYGVGVVLATQNPVDLDYKGLSNCGTWFIGRLQTERDKRRVLEGLEGVSAGAGTAFDRGGMEETLAGLGKRVFLMHNVHEQDPIIFHTRWAMSYLRGPLTRAQIKTLTPSARTAGAASTQPASPVSAAPRGFEPSPSRSAAPAEAPGQVAPSPGAVAGAGASAPTRRPLLAPEIPQFFLPVVRQAFGAELLYRPRLLAISDVQFVDTRRRLEACESLTMLATIEDGVMAIDWAEAAFTAISAGDLTDTPAGPARFADLPAKASAAKSYVRWRKSLADWLYRRRRYELFKSSNLNEISEPGESERDFRIRLADRAREERDLRVAKLRKKYASKFNTLRERIRKAELAVQREQEQARGAKMQTAISFGTTLLSAVLGRSPVSATTIGRATTAARGAGYASRQAQDVERARANLQAYAAQLEEMEAAFRQETEAIRTKLDPMSEELDTITLKPRKIDIDLRLLGLAWTPYARSVDGVMTPIWQSEPAARR